MVALEKYTVEEFADRLQVIQQELLIAGNPRLPEEPQAYLLGGQSGSGKTTLHKLLGRQLEDGAIVVNGDSFRKYHPRFRELQAQYGDKSVDYTAPWAGCMTEALIDAFSCIGYNLIVEGTLRTAEVPLATAGKLRQRGYAVSLALMAVKPEISLISCQLRYEQMRLAGTTPRATDPLHHRRIVDQIVENLAVLEDSGQFDSIQLFTRSRECLFPRAGDDRRASKVLEQALFGPWTEEETEHYRALQAKLEHLSEN